MSLSRISLGLLVAVAATGSSACGPAAAPTGPARPSPASVPLVAPVAACEAVGQRPGEVLMNADNGYMAFLGSAKGDRLRAISDGVRVPSAWDQPFHESIALSGPGDHLYVVAWDVGSSQMLIGQITRFDGSVVVTNTIDWESATGAMPPPTEPIAPARLEPLVAAAAWKRPAASAPNGSAPWGNLVSFGTCAQFIWHDSLNDPSMTDGKVAFFRTSQPIR